MWSELIAVSSAVPFFIVILTFVALNSDAHINAANHGNDDTYATGRRGGMARWRRVGRKAVVRPPGKIPHCGTLKLKLT
jgi:hypothetical protein